MEKARKPHSLQRSTSDNTISTRTTRCSSKPKKNEMQTVLRERDRKIACQEKLLKKLNKDYSSYQNHIVTLKKELESLRKKSTASDKSIAKLKTDNSEILRRLQDTQMRDRMQAGKLRRTEEARCSTRAKLHFIASENQYKDFIIKNLEKKLSSLEIIHKVKKSPKMLVRKRSHSLLPGFKVIEIENMEGNLEHKKSPAKANGATNSLVGKLPQILMKIPEDANRHIGSPRLSLQ